MCYKTISPFVWNKSYSLLLLCGHLHTFKHIWKWFVLSAMPQLLTEHFIFSLSPWVCVWSYCNCAANGMFCISHILSKQTNKKATNMVLMFLNRLNTSWFVLWICNQIIAVVQLDFPPFLFGTKREKKKWLNCPNTAVLEKCEYELRCLRNAKPNDLG